MLLYRFYSTVEMKSKSLRIKKNVTWERHFVIDKSRKVNLLILHVILKSKYLHVFKFRGDVHYVGILIICIVGRNSTGKLVLYCYQSDRLINLIAIRNQLVNYPYLLLQP